MKKVILSFFMLVLTGAVFAQSFVSGIVKAETGELIPGVTILLKGGDSGTRKGTVTDFDGKFSLNLSESNGVLIFSFVGMKTTEKSFNGNTSLDVVMETVAVGIDEIVAIGYGTQRKVSVIGAISTVTTKELIQSPAANLGNALTGRLPGLTTVQVSGQPGADDPRMYIRGRATWVNSNPLFIVDGIERESITNIDPNEIESITGFF